MGTCLSKKKLSPPPPPSSSSVNNKNAVLNHSAQASVVAVPAPVDPNTSNRSKNDIQQKNQIQEEEEEKKEEKEEPPTQQVKKEIFLIKHRKSHDDRDHRNSAKNPLEDSESAPAPAAVVRTSSCTKEEVDAILIQCGRLSRSSSGKAASSSSASRSRKYSGSKRSYDFDNNLVDDDNDGIVNDEGAATVEEKRPRERQRSHRRSSPRGSPSPQDSSQNQQQRSSSRERRVSRSPGRRCSAETAAPSSGNANRPGKMVSVPATVSSSLVMDKSNNMDSAANANSIKRISVKRNVGEAGSRGAASPRSQSPARGGNGNAKSSNEPQAQPSLSRNSSRKAEQSPYRRNPLSEIDPNSLSYPNPHNNNGNNGRAQSKSKRETCVPEEDENILVKELPTQAQKPNAETNYRSNGRVSAENKNSQPKQAMVETTVVISGADNKPQQTLTRSRSSRRSRDLDINPETLLNPNPTPSYTRLLLEDIQNFHQKNNNATTAVVSLPPCVSKACSILEAVADLNSATGSNLSCSAFSEDQFNKGTNNAYSSLLGPAKEPFVESEVIVGSDDLTEPSFHKYVTVRRGGGSGGLVVDAEDQESSGSNSIAGGSQIQNWVLSSSSWEPNSADSTDCSTSRSNNREEESLSGRMSDSHAVQPQRNKGIGRGRLGSAKGLHAVPVVAAAAST
ncbi:hypothetical protein L484_027140 [Morus notabilis]|uniref:Uncharacterized protein n=1 Tax=Morus notabilis TaxID=981085 RepID=W9SQ86_9ROSA|nr:uncharacterized protein At1g65710 [Morus notabilis]EXC20585.1 hypothetical protein L484_027140 [Morus notabilis]